MTTPCAGVVAVTDDWHVAVVWTKRGWASLPKGKRERGESDAACALRELKEEVGVELDAAELTAGLTAVEQSLKGNAVVTYFFAFGVAKRELRSNDPDEDIASVAWVPLEELADQHWRTPQRRVAIQSIEAYLDSRRKASAQRVAVGDVALRRGLVSGMYEATSVIAGGMERAFVLALVLSEYEALLDMAKRCQTVNDVFSVLGRVKATRALERTADAAVLPQERELTDTLFEKLRALTR